jgi:hypothetical protein
LRDELTSEVFLRSERVVLSTTQVQIGRVVRAISRERHFVMKLEASGFATART